MLIGEGDGVIVGEDIYPQTLTVLRYLGANMIPIGSDSEGLGAVELRKLLSDIKETNRETGSTTFPKVIYINPVGQTPTGVTMSLERKKEIYTIARENDLIILEDDPSYFLQFFTPLIPSLLSIDTDGRVVRTDSFSKLVAAGFRVGFISGPSPILERIANILEINSHPNNLGQAAVFKLLNHWGLQGFMKNAMRIRDFYNKQQESMERAAKLYLSDLAEWKAPKAGMFYWFR